MGKISERSPHQRRYMEGKNTWEDAPHMELGNCRLKQDTTAYLSEGPNHWGRMLARGGARS